ncbi:MAG: recombination regulator RecX [Zoogloeaceae bacterium]|jgi:regulatory protein|nr:recombination regulator RecX [Zoogloeaceae bacterium]
MAAHLRGKALALLARREYSRALLAKKLMPFAESEQALESVLDDLAASLMLSDARYASNRARARGSRYGNARLTRELEEAGVAAETISVALAATEDESRRCRAVWQKQFGALPDTLAERARQVRFLQYRGFSSDSIRQVLNGTEWDDAS